MLVAVAARRRPHVRGFLRLHRLGRVCRRNRMTHTGRRLTARDGEPEQGEKEQNTAPTRIRLISNRHDFDDPLKKADWTDLRSTTHSLLVSWSPCSPVLRASRPGWKSLPFSLVSQDAKAAAWFKSRYRRRRAMARVQDRDFRRSAVHGPVVQGRSDRPGNPCWDTDPMVVQIGSDSSKSARLEGLSLRLLFDHDILLNNNLR